MGVGAKSISASHTGVSAKMGIVTDHILRIKMGVILMRNLRAERTRTRNLKAKRKRSRRMKKENLLLMKMVMSLKSLDGSDFRTAERLSRVNVLFRRQYILFSTCAKLMEKPCGLKIVILYSESN
jgi:hypothetical protein